MHSNHNKKKGSRPILLSATKQDVQRLLKRANALKLNRAVKQKLRWFAYALDHDGNISLTCRHFAIAHSTYLRWAKRFDPTDLSTLEERSRRPHNVRTPETASEVVELIRQCRMEAPTRRKGHIQKKLQEERGVNISSSTVGRIIRRHCLFFGDTASHRQKRLNFGCL